jgi:peptidyl-prolyl cis-trans isomerase family protein
MNIFEKIQAARVELQEMNLKMGGYNKFADFKYFELKDFLPEINKIFNKLKLFSKFDLLENEGILTIINAEKTEEQVTFTTPKAEIVLKGQNGLQMIGSTHTYLKRYCYCNALEIVEDDAINATIDKEKTEINKPSVKKLSTDERRERGLKYISKMTTKYQKDIDKFLLGVTVLEIEELTNEQVSELANNIKKLEREGA